VQRRVTLRVGNRSRVDDDVRDVVELDVALELRSRRDVRLEREHAAARRARHRDRVEPDVCADVDEVAAAQVLAHEPELPRVEHPEQEVALQRFAQVEAQPHAARERRNRLSCRPDGERAPQSTLAAEVDAPEHGVQRPFEHRSEPTG
jgi:hypothetical protein